jgi:hypothetical protein
MWATHLNLYSMVADDPESFADLDGHDGNGSTVGPGASWAGVSNAGGGRLTEGQVAGMGDDAPTVVDRIEPDSVLQARADQFMEWARATGNAGFGAHNNNELQAKRVKHPERGTEEVKWHLKHKSKSGGQIVQEITTTDPSGHQTSHYWEAWPVNKGSKNTAYIDEKAYKGFDDMFRDPPGTTVKATARYYDGLTLPDSFSAHARGTTAGDLPATATDPQLPTNNATAPVERTWVAPPQD